MNHKLQLSVVLLFACLLLVLPTVAQDTIDTTILDTLEFEITGEVLFVGDELTVGGVIIAPASAFNPSTLQDGDLVTVTGILLDDDTLQATSLVFVIDSDEDGIEDTVDNCPDMANADQVDSDGDGVGDVCASDVDLDGVDDALDNCPDMVNADQADSNGDGIGDVCAVDGDGDGVEDAFDNCPIHPNADQTDSNGDGIGDACSSDMDEDGVDDAVDNCPATYNPDQADADGDGMGTVCDDVEEEGATACGNPNHPVAQRIADEFGVSYEEVMAMHCEGNGFGNIARAFLLGRATGSDAQDYLDKHKKDKMGWGNIVKEAQDEYPDIKQSDLAPGQIGKTKKNADSTTDDDADTVTKSNSGNGNGNSNNGNGNSNNNNGNSNNGNGNSNNNSNNNNANKSNDNSNKGGKKGK